MSEFNKGLSLRIDVWGHTLDDVELTLVEINRLIKEGFTLGSGKNKTAGFQFSIDGEEISTIMVKCPFAKGKLQRG